MAKRSTHIKPEYIESIWKDVPYRIFRGINNTIDRAILIVLIAALLFGVYYVYDVAYAFYHSSPERIQGYKPDDITEETLREISGDAVAWITVDDTKIDYPVMQGKDNVEYLNKAPDGTYSVSGSLFLDARSRNDFTDEYNLIYGHHMEGGFMLGALDSFEKKAFFDEHRTGTLYTKESEYAITFFGFCHADAGDPRIFGVGEGADPLAYLKEYGMIVYTDIKTEGKPLIALSTCKSPETTERRVLIGVLEEKQ